MNIETLINTFPFIEDLLEQYSPTHLAVAAGLVAIIFLWLLIKIINRRQEKDDEDVRSFYEPGNESHMDLVNRCPFRTQSIMNKPEFIIFKTLNKILASEFYVFPQVALGEVLASDEGYPAINAKRVDLLIVDTSGHAVAAVEFKGSGKHIHYQEDTPERDAIKFIALKKAGIKYIAITTTEESYLCKELEKAGIPLKSVQTA